jgi:hypothetical protein
MKRVRVANYDGCRALTVRFRYIGGAFEHADGAAQQKFTVL